MCGVQIFRLTLEGLPGFLAPVTSDDYRETLLRREVGDACRDPLAGAG
jgi:hypothetical protein